jgi:hypothetical protein
MEESDPGISAFYKNILGTLVPTVVLIVLSTMLLIFYSKDIGRAAGIAAGCFIVSALLARWSQKYIVFYTSGLKVFGYFLHSIPLLAGVMFISIGATLKLQEDGTYKMGDSEAPFGKTTGPEAYYITGSLLIAQFLFLLYPTYVLSKNNTDPEFDNLRPNNKPGMFDRLKNKFFSKNQQGSFTSSARLDGDGMPNFQWKCTKAGDEWHCKAEKNK